MLYKTLKDLYFYVKIVKKNDNKLYVEILKNYKMKKETTYSFSVFNQSYSNVRDSLLRNYK